MANSSEDRIPDSSDTTEAPLSMAASVVLTQLPRDSAKALEEAGMGGVQKSMYVRGVVWFFDFFIWSFDGVDEMFLGHDASGGS